ncbi:hypothetical protein MO867_09760 [Microbulbifer sp. OS29]|uniref:Uncharacterized protein n=1 Tax=Microbulbifer okhotskensis TaxID=2926617 RepID=A0A9X2ELV8_9GAMM|nr:hypothetical protein [Microbulbifer okhotskensis]MCO1334624.1 hypothetical protein [Microbulbifer okhotskensis]
MARKYIYIPINSSEMQEYAQELAKAWNIPVNQILANKFSSGVGKAMYRWVNQCLSKLTAADTLYVVTHGTGAGDGQFIGAERSSSDSKQKKVYMNGMPHWEGGEWKTYSPQQLANTLVKEGLPINFVNLHVCACGSGYDGEKLRPWAQRMHQAMAATYRNIRVTGYRGWFSCSTNRVCIKVGSQFYPLEERAVTFS